MFKDATTLSKLDSFDVSIDSKVDTIVCDLDGCLADNSHRQEFYPHNLEKFYGLVLKDKPIEPIIKLVDMFYWEMDYEVVILTSRPEYCRKDTEDWLFDHNITYNELIMRPKDNHDEEWKVKEIKSLKISRRVLYIIDDNPIEIMRFKKQNWLVVPIRSNNYEGR